ncbi:MAG TPA: exopolyphosphatase, partial [bacterium]|nr:exopolyphosphatase [bacterium]
MSARNDAAPGGPMTVAAVDLGSNSFHMVIARYLEHDLHMMDRLREPVRLAEGLQPDESIAAEVAERAIACLERFGQRLRGLPHTQVRAVGTNTMRQAQNARDFGARARKALGHPIEVISGQEEARLVYLGISHTHPMEGTRRLAVDIGGGSTEVIVGEGFEALRSHSLFMGCVRFSREFFPGGAITRDGFRKAENAAGLELQTVREPLRAMGWDSAVGSSGTINAVSELLSQNGLGGPEITLPRMKKLRKTLVAAGHVDRLSLAGLKPDRAPVLAGGLAILIGVFKNLEVAVMSPSSGALREGVLYDLVGRMEHQDVRDRTIRRLVDQYHVDLAHAGRVEATALGTLAQLEPAWAKDDAWAGEPGAARRLLTWASLLHEIGLTVSYTGYHKHG